MTKMRTLDVKKSELDKEITSLSLQADSRARLDLKREALRTKTSEVRNMYVYSTIIVGQCIDGTITAWRSIMRSSENWLVWMHAWKQWKERSSV